MNVHGVKLEETNDGTTRCWGLVVVLDHMMIGALHKRASSFRSASATFVWKAKGTVRRDDQLRTHDNSSDDVEYKASKSTGRVMKVIVRRSGCERTKIL